MNNPENEKRKLGVKACWGADLKRGLEKKEGE